MARLLGAVEALVAPNHGVIIVAGPAAEFVPGPDTIFLTSVSDQLHDAFVRLEAWDDLSDLSEMSVELTDGTLWVSKMLEGAASETLRVGPPGRYHVAVSVTGQDELRRLDAAADRPAAPRGGGGFLVRLWAAPPRETGAAAATPH